MSSVSRSEPDLSPDPNGLIHASAVAFGARAVLIIGPSGSGKSALALELMARGAMLVADDQVRLRSEGDSVIVAPPDALAGLIEARGVGLLAAEWVTARLCLVVDLGRTETDRLPPMRTIRLWSVTLPLVLKVDNGHFPAAIAQYVQGGRVA